MSRSVKKGPYVEERLANRIAKMNESGEKKVIKTWSRSSTILPAMVGHTIAVYDGRKHIPVYVTTEMVGLSLVNSHQQEHSKATRVQRQLRGVNNNGY